MSPNKFLQYRMNKKLYSKLIRFYFNELQQCLQYPQPKDRSDLLSDFLFSFFIFCTSQRPSMKKENESHPITFACIFKILVLLKNCETFTSKYLLHLWIVSSIFVFYFQVYQWHLLVDTTAKKMKKQNRRNPNRIWYLTNYPRSFFEVLGWKTFHIVRKQIQVEL